MLKLKELTKTKKIVNFINIYVHKILFYNNQPLLNINCKRYRFIIYKIKQEVMFYYV